MADVSIAGPLGECDFAQEDGLDPANGLPFARGNFGGVLSRNGRLFRGELGEALSEIARGLHRESRADLACIAQVTVFAIAQIQRSQRAVAFARIAIAENDELLPQRALDLQPAFLA